MSRRCQHPSHTSSSCCPLSSLVGVYLLNKTGRPTRPETLRWLDTPRPPSHPTPGLVSINGPHCSSEVGGVTKKSPDRVHLLLPLPLPEGGQPGLLLYIRLWGVKQFDMRVKENYVFTWSFVSEEKCRNKVQHKRINTHTRTPLRSSESAVSLAALWTHMSLPICLLHSVEINPWRHCVFNLRPEYHFLRLDVGGKVNVKATTNAYVLIMISPEENMNACAKLHGSAPSSFINQKNKKNNKKTFRNQKSTWNCPQDI